MTMLKRLAGAALGLVLLAQTATADITVSQSNNPTATIDAGVVSLLGAERTGMQKAVARLDKVAPRSRAGALDYSRAWLASLPRPRGDSESRCLAEAIYFEARGESVAGQAAVAEVVLNRVDDPAFPKTICGVVRQSGGGGCQFSWVCDGRADRIGGAGFADAEKIARALMDGAPRALTAGATYFHTPAVRPSWSRKFDRTAQIGAHIFYRAPIRTAAR